MSAAALATAPAMGRVRRGCGFRKDGGVYIECHLSDFGMPIENFIKCRPVPINPDDLGMSAIGVRLLEVNGVTHVFDIIGEEHYPNVLDFVKEVQELGASRRCELTATDYARLTKESRLIVIHRKAFIENFGDYLGYMDTIEHAELACPLAKKEHKVKYGELLPEMCSGLWKYDLTKKRELRHGVQFKPTSITLPSGATYDGYLPPRAIKPSYQHAIFMTLPISGLAVVDPKGTHQAKVNRARKSKLPVTVVAE